MGILDGIVEWIAEQVMAGLDLVTTSVLGALGCDMAVFLRYFPAAETMYSVFVALAIGIILLNWVWQLFKNFGLGAGVEAEDPVKLSMVMPASMMKTVISPTPPKALMAPPAGCPAKRCPAYWIWCPICANTRVLYWVCWMAKQSAYRKIPESTVIWQSTAPVVP